MASRANVLISTSTFPLNLDDGRPRFVFDLANALNDHCNVRVLAPGAPGYPQVEKFGAVDLHRFTYFYPAKLQRLAYRSSLLSAMESSWLAKLQCATFMLAEIAATRNLLNSYPIDLINSHWLVPQGLSTAILRSLYGPRFRHVVSIHAADIDLLTRIPFGKQIAEFVLDHTDYVFSDGGRTLNTLSNLVQRQLPSQVQPMGIHLGAFSRPNAAAFVPPFGGNFILFVGRMVEKKGITYLLQALPAVLKQSPATGLVLVGDGPMLAEAKALAQQLGIEKNTLFLGRRPHPEVIAHMKAARFLVIPSVVDGKGETEGMPTVIIEGLAAGKRVVASAVAGIPDIIEDGKNGALCRPRDHHDLAAKISAELQRSYVSRDSYCLATAAEHDWAKIANRYAAVIGNLLGVSEPETLIPLQKAG